MSTSSGIWLRREVAPTEQRTPLVPADAASLVANGTRVTVEESDQRAFAIDEYAAAGCRVVPADSWPDSAPDEVVLGLKEPSGPFPLTHDHIFFGHAYKGQEGGARLLRRFMNGGGTLFDLESLTDDSGRRVAAFGQWAGYVGAALAVLHHCGELVAPLVSTSRSDLDARLRDARVEGRALVIGALGRCGRGATEALAVAGMPTTRWDLDETRDLDTTGLLDHDLMVNAVLTDEPGDPFLTEEDLDRERRLTVISDVTCDVTSACNRLPIYEKVTDWAEPVRCLRGRPAPLSLIAIDNLPGLLPKEASTAFSAALLPHLIELPGRGAIWDRCRERFLRATRYRQATPT